VIAENSITITRQYLPKDLFNSAIVY